VTVLAVTLLLAVLALLAWTMSVFNRPVRLRVPGGSSGSGGGGSSGGGGGR
jgi:hypothetical protein